MAPNGLAPEELHVPQVKRNAPLLGYPVAILVKRELFGGGAQVVHCPVVGRISHAGSVEHVLVVEEHNCLEVTRQAIVAVVACIGLQWARIEGVEETGRCVNVGLQVEEHAA